MKKLKTTLTTSLLLVVVTACGQNNSHGESLTQVKPGNKVSCIRACRKEFGKHITKAIPVDGRGCYCYP